MGKLPTNVEALGKLSPVLTTPEAELRGQMTTHINPSNFFQSRKILGSRGPAVVPSHHTDNASQLLLLFLLIFLFNHFVLYALRDKARFSISRTSIFYIEVTLDVMI